MCGRTSCNLSPALCQKATSYLNRTSGKYEKPFWNEVSNGGFEFVPSPNIAPSEITPVLLSGNNVEKCETKYALQPMVWGMIPPWHKGDFKGSGLSTNNCRLENILTSRLYAPPLKKGKRCVIICEGFYEWQEVKGQPKKQPHFIYLKQEGEGKIEDQILWIDGQWSEEEGWKGPKLLYMAGVYDEWKPKIGDTMYSYSTITLDSNETMKHIHHRMPAVLETWEDVEMWLDVENVPFQTAVENLKSPRRLSHHPVSYHVNNARNKDTTCNQRVNIKSDVNTPLLKWLTSKKSSGAQKTETKEKKPQIDDKVKLKTKIDNERLKNKEGERDGGTPTKKMKFK